MRHRLKCENAYFDAVAAGDKTFEIRYNDRGFQKGDSVTLSAWNTEHHCYDSSKPVIELIITYVCTYHQKEGWCVFGFKRLSEQQSDGLRGK